MHRAGNRSDGRTNRQAALKSPPVGAPVYRGRMFRSAPSKSPFRSAGPADRFDSTMIRLHHPHGTEFFLNTDLVESVVAGPETTVTLFDGRTFEVRESASTVVELIRTFRASVLREAEDMRAVGANLILLPGGEG